MFLFVFKLLKFSIITAAGVSQSARFKALETVSSTIIWLADKEDEIEHAFRPRSSLSAQSFQQSKEKSAEFKQKFQKILNESKEFQDFKNKLFRKA